MRKRQIHRLSEAQVRNAKPKEITEPLPAAAPALLPPPADVLSLAQARHRAQQLRLMRLDGIDPITAKQGKAAAEAIAAAKAMTFDQAVDAYVADHGAKWGSYRHAQIWRKSLEQHVSPVF